MDLKSVMREVIVTFGPAVVAILTELQRQVTELQQPDWRVLAALALAQACTIVARMMAPPSSEPAP